MASVVGEIESKVAERLQDQLSILSKARGPGAISRAIASAVEQYSKDRPLEKAVSVDGDGAVRYGLGALRGLGKKAVAEIVGQRPFASVADFFRRVDVNKRDTIALVGSGALDSLSPRRSLIPSIEALVKWGRTERKSTASGQMPLFG